MFERGIVACGDSRDCPLQSWLVPEEGAGIAVAEEADPSYGAVLGSPVDVDANIASRGRTMSLNSLLSGGGYDRNETPRPSGSVTPRRLSRMRSDEPPRIEDPVPGMGALNSDVSVLTRKRVQAGYGPDVSLSCLGEAGSCLPHC